MTSSLPSRQARIPRWAMRQTIRMTPVNMNIRRLTAIDSLNDKPPASLRSDFQVGRMA